MGRLFRAIAYFFSGKLGTAWETLLGNTNVIKATYDQAMKTKGQNALELQQAVGNLITSKSEKVATVTRYSSEVAKLTQVKAGALAKAKDVSTKLTAQGKTPDQIKSHPEYIRCQAAFENANKDLLTKQAEITRLESAVAADEIKIAKHKATLERMKQEVKNLESEKNDTVASIEAARQEKMINDALNGITQDTSDQDLIAVRKKRDQVINEANVASELAGTNPEVSQNEFMDYANRSTAASEFDSLIGLDGAKDSPSLDPSKLPEN